MSEAKKTTFIAVYPVRLDGKTHAPGQSLALTDDQAAPLLARKIVQPDPAAADPKPAKAQGSKA